MSDIEHSFMAGSNVAWERSLFFELMQTDQIYMGFAREEPIWGFLSLFKILHTRTWATNIMGQANSGSPDADAVEKFYDVNSADYLLAGEIPASSSNVYIAYISNSADASVLINYTFLEIDAIGLTTLEYMNDEWASIRGVNGSYLDTILLSYGVDDYDYYLFNYTQDIESRTKISTIEDMVLSTIEYPVRLMYSTTENAGYPTTAFGDNLVGSLTRSMNIFGETIINGLEETFVTDDGGYIDKHNLGGVSYFLTNNDGIVLQDNMNYVSTYESGDEVSVIFSYPLVGEAVQNSGRMKIRNAINPKVLCVFHESYSGTTAVSDLSPPPLLLNYLKMGMIHSSLFDVLGMVQITSSDVAFARRIDNQATKDTLIAAGMSETDFPTGNLDSMMIEGDTETEVEYFVTTDASFARQYYFDLVRVNKEMNTTTPTDAVYRQLFVCYKPLEEDGATVCSDASYVHGDLFNETDHKYNLGTILYISNKPPVYRKYIDGNEEITILI